jgi:hypothetical protein
MRSAVAGFIDRVADGYASTLRRVVPFRGTVVGAATVLVAASVWMAMKLPSTFFPEIDESMERVYVRLMPGTSLSDASRKINQMAAMLAKELPKDDVELVLTNVGSPQNARSAMNSPNAGPHMGFIRVALSSPDRRKASQREIADKTRELLNRNFPGVEFLQWPGGLVASVFSNGYLAPLVVEVSGDNLQIIEDQARSVAAVAQTVPGIRDIYPSLQVNYPEIRVETDRTKAGMVGVSAPRPNPPWKLRSATSTRPAFGSMDPTASPTTSLPTSTDGLSTTPLRWPASPCASATPAARSRSAPIATSAARSGRSPSRETACNAWPMSSCRPRGGTSVVPRVLSNGN